VKKKKSPSPVPKPKRSSIVLWGIIAVVLVLLLSLIWLRKHKPAETASSQPTPVAVTDSATFVGSERCQSCHAKQTAEWRQSQHHDAMAHANAQTVLANFDNTTFTYAGITSTFFKRDGKFYARTDGPDGKLTDYEIKYTYGVYPLQQYLIEFADGRVQPLQIAWDTRPASEHGQHWFHLYPNDKVTHTDELHWTRPAQNWNYMCADCHSTDLQKNYDAASNQFHTTWSEISVGCEACHGPGSRHLAWATTAKTAATNDNKGLTANFSEDRGVSWNHDANGNPVRSRQRTEENEIEVCAQCHSRRSQIEGNYTAGQPFLEYYRPALLTAPLYYPDGQQHGEVYKWGSFLQSKMYAAGVTCSDCHNPHTGKLLAQGNSLCVGCHLASKYDTAQHHHHTAGSDGAKCVNCHMPTTNYMVVDPRHDHSLRVPRPDQSVAFGVPNACNNCHTKHDAKWAAAQVKKWYGHDPQGYQTFASAFAAAAADAPGAQTQLRAIANDEAQPPIVRASALAQIIPALHQPTLEALAVGTRDANALVRLGALQSLTNAPMNVRLLLAGPLLSDPIRSVRIDAASILAAAPADKMDASTRAAFESAAKEFIESQRYNADRAEAHVNLGTFYASQGDMGNAVGEIKTALQLNPLYIPAYVNLADIYRADNRDAEGAQVLQEGIKLQPDSAVLHYALGLNLVRTHETEQAVNELQRAAELEPANAQYAYIYAVALHSTGQPKVAIAYLEKTLRQHPYDRNVLQALASFYDALGDKENAQKYAQRLQDLMAQEATPQ
jgi:predicted CXXCH cytochrome family protein